MFKNKSGSKSGTAGRGKSAILRAQAARGRGRGGPPPGNKGPGGNPGNKTPWQGPQGGRGRGGI